MSVNCELNRICVILYLIEISRGLTVRFVKNVYANSLIFYRRCFLSPLGFACFLRATEIALAFRISRYKNNPLEFYAFHPYNY